MQEDSFNYFLQRSIACLKESKIEYVIVGGTLMPFYGNVRSTIDIDIMLLVTPEDKDKIYDLINCFENNEISITYDEIMEGMKENIHTSAIDTNSWIYRLDIKKITTPFDQFTYNNRKVVSLSDIEVPISCPESLIAIKISDGFKSDTDLEDVLALIEITELDLGKLNEALGLINSRNNLILFLKECVSLRCGNLLENLLRQS